MLAAPCLILKYDMFKAQPEKMSSNYLVRKVKDPELRKKLTPIFKFGCKRVLVSSDWCPTMQKDHVHLQTIAIDCVRCTPAEYVLTGPSGKTVKPKVSDHISTGLMALKAV